MHVLPRGLARLVDKGGSRSCFRSLSCSSSFGLEPASARARRVPVALAFSPSINIVALLPPRGLLPVLPLDQLLALQDPQGPPRRLRVDPQGVGQAVLVDPLAGSEGVEEDRAESQGLGLLFWSFLKCVCVWRERRGRERKEEG